MRDSEIVELYWNRDESAIVATADTYGGYCYSIAYNILYNNEDAEECVNDTWLNTWRSIPPQRPARLSTYLGKITRNLSINRYNRQAAKKRGAGQMEFVLTELDECVPSPMRVEEAVEELVLVSAIEDFLRKQYDVNRKIFVGRYWYLYSIADLAVAYGMSESKVSSLLFRMRKGLKKHLEKEGIFL